MTERLEAIAAEAQRILQKLEEHPFEQGYVLSREFNEFPNRPGIYAVKHRQHGILYVGKSGNIRNRFRGGHKSLCWAFIDRHDPDDVRVIAVVLSFVWTRLSLNLERIIIRQLLPPYNDVISQEE
jgi:excinuclease UvrABC nuclease subunit